MRNFAKLFLLFITASFISCASNKSRPESYITIKGTMKGSTTKASVIKSFGSPEVINSDTDTSEQWVYSKHCLNKKSLGSSGGSKVWNFAGNARSGLDIVFSNDCSK